MDIALLGYGTVGKSIDSILRTHACDLTVKHIFRRPGTYDDPRMTDDYDAILTDPGVTCVVDVLAGRDPALDMIRRALAAGKHVVSANKAALAADLAGLTALARAHGVHLLFEASCGGGIPWVEALKKATRLDRISRISGILNGTCNFMIDSMESRGLSFADALVEAQALGYAEADPTADISGADVRNKAVISAALAWGAPVPPDFPVAGIERLTQEKLVALRNAGKCLRLMMIGVRKNGAYALGVVPVVLPASAPEAAVRKNFNCATLTGDVVGPLTFIGQGAGGFPTADAVIQDLITLQENRASTPGLTGTLQYDPALLKGTGYLGTETVCGATLEALVHRAHCENLFLAFEPDCE